MANLIRLSRRRTESVGIRSKHACSGQTLQQEPVLSTPDELALRHRPQTPPCGDIRSGVEPLDPLLERELHDGRELAEEHGGATHLELRYDAELPFEATGRVVR